MIRNLIGLAIIALGLGLAPPAGAQTSTHAIAYQGHLELSGDAQSGSYHFRFSLYTSATDGECTTPTTECLWTDTFNSVPVTRGHFSVLLGSGAALSDAVWQNDVVYLGIEVMHETDIDFTALAGRQRIAAIPVAARAETAKDYRVTGTLEVDGTIVSHGVISSAGIAPRYQAWASQGTGDGGAGIYNDNGTYKALMLVGNNSAGGSTRRVRLYDEVTVNGAVTTTGAITVGGNLVANSNTRDDTACDWSDPFSEEGSGHELCPSGQFVAGVQCLSGSYCDNMRIYCCPL